MALCLKCAQESNYPGILCPTCQNAYTVLENHGADPLNILGTLLINKFVPIAFLHELNGAVVYLVWQVGVERRLELHIIKPDFLKNANVRQHILKLLNQRAAITQQNLPAIIEVSEIPTLHSMAVSLDAIKGDSLDVVLDQRQLDSVQMMHIIHQILQAMRACHMKGLTFPGLSMRNVIISRSGDDASFVKIYGIFDSNISREAKTEDMLDDVYAVGQIALSCITGQKIPITTPVIPENKIFLLPIVQIFERAIAPKNQRFQSCVELLHAFESAFDLNSHANVQEVSRPVKNDKPKQPRMRTPLTLPQIVSLHQPPRFSEKST